MDNLEFKINVHDKVMKIPVPLLTIDIERKKNDVIQDKRAPVKVPGAPDLLEYKQEQEDLLNEQQEDESLETEIKLSIFPWKRKKQLKLLEKMQEQEKYSPDESKTTVLNNDIPFITLRCKNAGVPEIVICKEKFCIGRTLDYLSKFDYLSRCHGLFYSTDYQHIYFGDCSTNCNYLNKQPLTHYAYYQLRNNDTLRLSKLEFQVIIEDL